MAQVEEAEIEALTARLAEHFVALYGAPDVAAAMATARDEIAYMEELCEDHDPNTLLVVQRELTESGVRESFRTIQPSDAELDLVAIHGSVDTWDAGRNQRETSRWGAWRPTGRGGA